MSSSELETISERALAGLKDFQRETVDYVFDRLYAKDGSRRFLVADEVGLGKTLIARGVIARAIAHLRPKVPRIDVIYICSNGDIARQNINRLKVEGEHVSCSTRLTLLPREIERLRQSKSGVNFVSFTPATSFDLHEGLGQVDERVLLYALLREHWDLGARVAPMNVFQGHVGTQRFRERAQGYSLDGIDPERKTLSGFVSMLARHDSTAQQAGAPDLRTRFEALTRAYARDGAKPEIEVARERMQFIGELRALLAGSCIAALDPDLIILDEFQRFGHLLEGQDEAGQLARELFGFKDVAVLLLSATPYKMYTAADEAQGEDHYRDFLRTLRFLERRGESDRQADGVLARYRKALLGSGDAGADGELRSAVGELEARLRRVMVRTERLAATPDRNGMLVEKSMTSVELEERDVRDYLGLQEVARSLEQPDTLEYWKSAPFLLNFMDEGYKLKREFDRGVEDAERRTRLARALSAAPTAVLPWAQVEQYGKIDAGNGRLRALIQDTVGRGAHRLLWVPPSLPYYGLRGAFGEAAVQGFTKRLIFSSWRLVPRVIAACLSYEAERRMIGTSSPGAYLPDARKKRARLLRFNRDQGRLGGMPVLALMYPSAYLARACDPASLATRCSDAAAAMAVTVEQILAEAEATIEVALRRIGTTPPTDGPEDERWYWAAPLLLDRTLEPVATSAWFAQSKLASVWAGEHDEEGAESEAAQADTAAWDDHVREASSFALGAEGGRLGRPPTDLVQVLARMAIGGPGVTMLRSMLRVVGMRTDALAKEAGVRVRNGAAQAAWSFRHLFNQPEVMSLLEGPGPYWRQVLDYCVDGCLQSVLDEYAHVLRDHLGLTADGAADRVHQIAEQICEAMSLRTANLGLTDLGLSEAGRTLRPTRRRMRCHFALRFGDERSEDGTVATRADSVRKAFNSPFWPFVVATTSVGQEGLDFHTYCHAVVHWNLPSNPVDLEQREGRVHRFKGHAVRRNVASAHGAVVLRDGVIDAWDEMFEVARRTRKEGTSDIVPFWVYTEGDARIERHVPAFALSREHAHLQALSRSLAVYRMVFGQPRQDDLLRYLTARFGAGRLDELLEMARIDLAPRSAGASSP